MILRWLPWLAKTLKFVLRTRSCHSARVAEAWVRSSARAGIRPLTPRVTAVAEPESATRKVAELPLMTASVTTADESRDLMSQKPAKTGQTLGAARGGKCG